MMRERHRRGAEPRRVGDRKINLVLGWYSSLEGDAIGLGDGVADPVLDEEQALLLFERGSEVRRTADQARLAFLADAALEDRLDEDHAGALDQSANLLFARTGIEDLGGRIPDETQHPGSVQHAGDLHLMPPSIAHRQDAAAQLSGSFQRVSLFRANRRSTESEPKDFAA